MSVSTERAESALVSPDLKTTSLNVAESFGKRHQHVVRAIKELDIPEEYRLTNFGETVVERQNPSGGASIKSKAYEMTRDGFVLLAMGFTGKKAMAWKIKYLQAFNAMEAALADKVPALPRPKLLTNAQRRMIQHLIRERWPDNDECRDAYDRLKGKFQVPRYWDIPQSRFDEAVAFIEAEKHARRLTVTFPVERPAAVFDDATRIAAALYMVKDCSKAADALYANARFVEEAFRDLSRNFAALHQKIKYAHAHAGEFLGPE